LYCPQVFFCKYNDPIYVKMEKLEIMIKLANEKNIDQVLLEFKEYAQEVDVDFVRKVRPLAGAMPRVWIGVSVVLPGLMIVNIILGQEEPCTLIRQSTTPCGM
jgi:hypothetical protein